MSIDLSKLALPFDRDNIEWRVQEAGKTRDGKVWAKVIPYITSRGVMQRLDDVCGPANWRNEFKEWRVGENHGVLCGISIRIGDEWVSKFDGSDPTGIEAIKGGFSGAMKRAAVHWGIGRFLYALDAYFAQIVEKGTDGAFYAKLSKDKGGDVYYWLPPQLKLGDLSPAERDKLLGAGKDAPPANEGSNGKKGRTPSKRSGNDIPSNASSDCANALSALRNCFDTRKLQRYKQEISTRIENGTTYSADDVKLLEAGIAEAEARLNAPKQPVGADEPDAEWIKGRARELGCPETMVDMIATLCTRQADPAKYLDSRPWIEETANA
jgi:hypothetical protein